MEDIIQDGAVLDKNRLLFEKGDGNIIVDLDSTAFGGLITGKDFEEGGFPAAVAGDKGYFIPFFDMKCDILEQWLYAV